MSELAMFEWRGIDAFDRVGARDALRRQGAILVRGLLDADEIVKAREQVRARLTVSGERIQLGKTQPNAALVAPEIGWLVGHGRVIDVFRALLDDELCFTGHCDIHMNMLSGWHKDSGESVGGYFKGDYFNAPECCVYKAAVYLQDATPEDGLTVRLGSHLRADHAGHERHVPSKTGDVVFFDVRLSHVGQRPDLIEKVIKGFIRPFIKSNRREPAWATGLKDAYWKAIGRRERLSVFFTYGKRNAFTADFANANMERQYNQTGGSDTVSPMPSMLGDALSRSGVAMIELSHVSHQHQKKAEGSA